MSYAKLTIIFIFAAFFVTSCLSTRSGIYKLSDSKDYEASLFRQNCAICHGPEGEGRTLEDGTIVPSLRAGEFKFRTEVLIRNQIENGGNGMPPFRDQLTQHELDLMAAFVHDKLRQPVIK
jgi:mono/diheme cytochrome c family protein